MTKQIGMAAVFLAGCAVGGVSSQLAVPKASAQQAATLTRWENICIENSDWADVGPSATKAGGEGWEMVGFTSNGVACFKRPRR